VSAAFLLSPAEVRDLTGSPQRGKQLAWFVEHGIKAEVGTDGKVKVLRAAVEARMMGGGSRTRAKTEPDLSALRKAS